ncbi:MAG: hypothetical protein ACI9NC_005362 [Verrucomicrobiales bacterium]|jgi:hypothetical protein
MALTRSIHIVANGLTRYVEVKNRSTHSHIRNRKNNWGFLIRAAVNSLMMQDATMAIGSYQSSCMKTG